MSRDENPQRENKIDSPSFKGFHAQLANTRIVYKVLCSKAKQKKNKNDEKYNQTGITVKIHTNHDGVRANMIMLRSIAARSSWRSPVIAVKQASETTSATLRVKK